ncbi:MAG TPA: 3-oxoacyl-ACP reductase FabG [Burkholderiales bacterium]|nr:3-oxoacyl-ACP reductase FabG [Burkholderiales bacterium]
MNPLEGKVALITGASRGIGREIALELGRQGAVTTGTATSEAGAAAIGQMLSGNGIGGTGLVMNVNDASQVEAALARIEAEFGGVAILVNNAGVTRDNLLLRMKDDEWDDIMSTNLKGVYRLSKLVLKSMMKVRYGRIINITSVVGAMGNAGQTNYAAAKAGVGGFSRSLAREVGSRNITVNCVAPGFIETEMTAKLNEEQRAMLMRQIPLARLGTVRDVAAAVAFLASPGASYITGCTLHVNGGMYME